MARQRLVYQCQQCAYTSPKWLGKCPECGSWNSFAEGASGPDKGRGALPPAEPILLDHVPAAPAARVGSGLLELDRVLGGGIVPGSVVLIGGSPGIGKSTILIQVAGSFPSAKVLYVAGEESPAQIKMRADRLGIDGGSVVVLAETLIENALAAADRIEPDLLVVDSVQTMVSERSDGAAGSVSQVREVALELMRYAKEKGRSVFIVGHVTKEGAIAGPRVLEHIVDTVLYFEGDRGGQYRIVRAVKNRFGSVNEIAVFRMTATGLADVANPSEVFISEASLGVPGSAVFAGIEGARPILAEIQTLIVPSAFGMPRRTVLGIDPGRVHMVIAVLERRLSLGLQGLDIYISVVGGLKLEDPATDLAVAAAVVSAVREKPVPRGMVLAGEIGLAGELRPITSVGARIQEAEKLGFSSAILPRGNTNDTLPTGAMDTAGLETVEEAIERVFLRG